jgi:hypothetical protein
VAPSAGGATATRRYLDAERRFSRDLDAERRF